jgi:class 3 adenylate cyclase
VGLPTSKDAVNVYVLYMDIVDSTRNTVHEQDRINVQLRDTVMATAAFREASEGAGMISLPTGDGMALVFLRKLDAPLRCAIEIANALQRDHFCGLRMGIHCGPVIIENDINGRHNVSGDGISLAARVMSCGSDGHILLTRNAADLVKNLEVYVGKLSPLGERQVKKDRIEVWNFVDGPVGNRAGLTTKRGRFPLMWTLVAGILVATALAGFMLRPQKVVSPKAAPPLPLAETKLGFNLWRMRPSPPGADFKTRGFVLENDSRGEMDVTPELVPLEQAVKEQGRVRITVQPFQQGYLYVVDRDLYADGSKSAPKLIFPDTRILDGDNFLQPFRTVGIPPSPQAFTVKRTRANQTAILLMFVLSPKPLPGIGPQDHEQKLAEETVTGWEKEWGGEVDLMENKSMAGELYTSAEFKAEKSQGAPAKQPISLFRRKGHPNEPLVATAQVKIEAR